MSRKNMFGLGACLKNHRRSRCEGAPIDQSLLTSALTVSLWLLALSAFSANAGEVSGLLSANATWSAAQSPYLVTSSIVVGPGVTLTIEPGASVHLTAGADFVVTNGGRLLAEGAADKEIRFSRPPGTR